MGKKRNTKKASVYSHTNYYIWLILIAQSNLLNEHTNENVQCYILKQQHKLIYTSYIIHT